MKINIYSIKGVKSGELALPKEFGEKPNMALLAQAIRVYDGNAHIGMAKTKTRAEVNRTKKKLYRQKGTGGARHGSRRAPIFVGGGVAHGPRPIRRVLSLPLKMKKKALAVTLSLKAKNGEIVGVSGIDKLIKTKDAQILADKIFKEIKSVKRLTFVLGEVGFTAKIALRNLKNVQVLPFKDINAYHIYFGGGLVIDKEVFEKVSPIRPTRTKKVLKVKKTKSK